ncbi:MAG TPA: type IV pilus modification protein PilV [Steroidobacter sp.]
MKHQSIGKRTQRGVGLIEVLISLLVLSIGMLGLAGLQLFSLRNNQGAMERSMAVVETHSIADAMRADRVNALAGFFDTGRVPARSEGTTFASQSLATWQANLETTLGPSAVGTVECTTDGTGVCTIRVSWTDDRSIGSSTDERQSSSAREVVTVVHL